jgi:hypothetical protein
MKLLITADQINSELTRMIRACESLEIAVAWASVGFKAFDLLKTHAKKIKCQSAGKSSQ